MTQDLDESWSYPDPLEPVDFIVEQHLCVGQVDVAVVGIVQKVPEQGEVVPSMLGPLLSGALKHKQRACTFTLVLYYLEQQEIHV